MKSSTKKHKNGENLSINRSQKGHIYSMRNKTRRQSMTCSTSAGSLHTRWCKNFTALTCSWTLRTLWALILGLQTHFSEQANLQIWNPWIMRINCAISKYIKYKGTKYSNWPTTLCWLLVHNMVIQYFYTFQNYHYNKPSCHLSPYKGVT